MGLLDITPHKVSRDLRGYTVLFYGPPKVGKTTIASKFPNALLLAAEKGYSALAGVYAQPINNWSDFLKVVKELKDPQVQSKFSTVVIDTADLLYDFCERYICNMEGVDAVNKIPYGGGYTKTKKEFDDRLRQIVQMGYGLVLISHEQDKTFTNEDGTEFNKITMTLNNQAKLVTTRLCDIIAYARPIETDAGVKTFLFMRGTNRFDAGSRFKHTPNKIEFSYDNLVNAIADAIDKQAAEDGGELVTEERENLYLDSSNDYDYDALIEEFNGIIKGLLEKNKDYYIPRITEIVDRHLGKGNKVTDTTRDQVMLVEIIVSELRELI